MVELYTVVIHFNAPFEAGVVVDWEQLVGSVEAAQALARYVLQNGLEAGGVLVPRHMIRGVQSFPGDVRGTWHNLLPR